MFGPYIHKYYYNQSIADGYTLKLIREEVETSYKARLRETLERLEVEAGSIPKKALYSHPKFVGDMLTYILNDFRKGRKLLDSSIGGMIVCDSSEQAREIAEQMSKQTEFSYALVLHDEGSKQHIIDHKNINSTLLKVLLNILSILL